MIIRQKENINRMSLRKSKRHPLLQHYRDSLASTLKTARNSWKNWKDLANKLLKAEKTTVDYAWENAYLRSLIDGQKISKDVAIKLIEDGWVMEVINNLWHVDWLDKELFLKILDAIQYVDELPELSYFEWLDKDVAIKLIDEGAGFEFYNRIEIFEWLDKDVALKMLWTIDWNKELANNLDKFEWLDNEVATKLIEWYLEEPDKNKEQSIVEKIGWKIDKLLPNAKYTKKVAKNLKYFNWLDSNTAKILIKKWYTDEVAKNLGSFEWLDKVTAYSILWMWELEWEWGASYFIPTNKEYGKYIAEHLNKFHWLDRYIAVALFDCDCVKDVVDNIDSFDKLDRLVARELINFWYWDFVWKNSEKFWL